ncbi:MAG: hypothetical protein IPP66_18845 [Anaerolineales bacterium]|nr:hypothetical protein [Anaerolineales bacterium]
MSLPDLASFTEHVGSTFEVVDVPPSPFELKMTRVVELSKTEHNEAFSVFFLGPLDRFMTQGTRKLSHVHFGELEIFLVPVAKTNDGFEYEAAFNYILKK